VDDGRYIVSVLRAAHLTEVERNEIDRDELGQEALGRRNADLWSGPRVENRVSFAGDAGNASVSTPGRSLISLHPALASWYDDAGNTACGFHAGDGVASKSLPCGTKVTFAYHGRTVTAVVDDRGPFVPGRQFDLDQATAAALGFDGVDTVWSSV